MDDHLSRLEAKVVEAIGLIQDLRQENGRLQDRCGELESELAEARAERERMRSQLEEASATAAQAEQFEQKRREIETKVSGLLEKLEAMG
jgi:predicted  nucleic acid-binding Zn-ribbon protein